jgi:ubiquitin carboxyl-terminal hydrolase 8
MTTTNTYINNNNNSELFSKYQNKGLSGLANAGNTCYLNSCMQIISHTYELNEFLDKSDYKNRLNRLPDSIITLEWDKLRDLLWKSNCIVAPYGFLKCIKKVAAVKNRDIFTGYAQNDLQEFLLFIIDCFHMSLSRVVEMNVSGISQNGTDELAYKCYTMMKEMYFKEYSEMLGIFYGIHVSEITHLETGQSLSLRPEPFSVLSLSIPQNTTIDADVPIPITLFDCIELYCKKEVLTGDEAWFNEKTGQKQTVNRGIIFWSLPQILIIDLKRWHGHTRKNHIKVEAPIHNADFSKYVKGYNSASYIYDLYGVCNHLGDVGGGHYTAYIKNANNKWYEFNDTNVREIPESIVVSPQSYCFFYRKIKTQ